LSKATFRQLLIVVCSLSVVSNVTPAPPPQESPHRDKDAGGGRITMPNPPPCDRRPRTLPRLPAWLLLLLPPAQSGHAEPRQSATWPMINVAGCGAKSSPSGGAVVPVWGRTCRRHPGPGGPPCGGVAKVAVPGSGVRGGGGGGVSRRGLRRHRAWQNTPASPPAGRRESRTRTCAGQRHGSANAGALRA
jgi:hypothetical protein